MKRKLFDLGLYKEGLRRSRVIGIVGAIICALISIGNAVIGIVDKYMYADQMENARKTIVGYSEVFAAQSLIYIVIVPLMVLSVFNFLNKRRDSDFFHSVPQTRICVFISFMMAIITWIFSTVILVSLVDIILYAAFSNFYVLNIVDIVTGLLGLLVSCLLVMSAIAFAMSLTGTLFNNIVVSLLVIFVPRILMLIFTQTIMTHVPFVEELASLTIMNTGYNLVTDFVLSIFTASFTGQGFTMQINAQSIIYTAILGIIYFVVGTICFSKRKSETAGNASPNKFVQGAYRIAIALPITLLGTCICVFNAIKILINMGKDTTLSQGDLENLIADAVSAIIIALVIYFAAIILYFLYELVSTKKWKNLLRAFPGLLVVLGINVIVLGGMYGVFYAEVNNVPEAVDIKYITVSEHEDRDFYDIYYDDDSNRSYFKYKASKIEITEAELKIVVADILEKNAHNCKFSINADPGYYLYSQYDMAYPEGETEHKGGEFEICVKKGIGLKKYVLYFGNDDYETLMRVLSENDSYKNVYNELPDPNKYSTLVYTNDRNLSYEAGKNIYKKALEDIKKLSFEEKYALLNLQAGNNGIETLEVSSIEHGVTYQLDLPIYMYMENAYDTLWTELDKATEEDKQYISYVLEKEMYPPKSEKINYLNVNFYVDDNYFNEQYAIGLWGHEDKAFNEKRMAVIEEFFDMLLENSDTKVNGKGNYCEITVQKNSEYLTYEESYHRAYFALPEGYLESAEYKEMCNKLIQLEEEFYNQEYYNGEVKPGNGAVTEDINSEKVDTEEKAEKEVIAD